MKLLKRRPWVGRLNIANLATLPKLTSPGRRFSRLCGLFGNQEEDFEIHVGMRVTEHS